MRKPVSQMSFTEVLLRAARRFATTRSLAESIIRRLVARKSYRSRVNKYFDRISADERTVFQNLTSKAFREKELTIDDGHWSIKFGGNEIFMPLRNGSMWLDWDNAISITGHDPDVKRTYENLLVSEKPPKVFFDIGANYGTHSLLFLSQGVSTVSFEPNPVCIAHFETLCSVNDVEPHVAACAVGDRQDTVDFWFPKRDTWLGTMVESTKEVVSEDHELEQLSVELTTIDDYCERNRIWPDLIKIDTEGNELNVIKGAETVIRSYRPIIIFECNTLSDRGRIFEKFEELKYEIKSLPYDPASQSRPLPVLEFETDAENNFVALPKP